MDTLHDTEKARPVFTFYQKLTQKLKEAGASAAEAHKLAEQIINTTHQDFTADLALFCRDHYMKFDENLTPEDFRNYAEKRAEDTDPIKRYHINISQGEAGPKVEIVHELEFELRDLVGNLKAHHQASLKLELTNPEDQGSFSVSEELLAKAEEETQQEAEKKYSGFWGGLRYSGHCARKNLLGQEPASRL